MEAREDTSETSTAEGASETDVKSVDSGYGKEGGDVVKPGKPKEAILKAKGFGGEGESPEVGVVPETGEGRAVLPELEGEGAGSREGGMVGSDRDPEEMELALLKRAEATVQSSLAIQNKLQELTQIIQVAEEAPREIPLDNTILEPVKATQVSGELVGDAIAHAALIGGVPEEGKEEEVFQATQPCNSAMVDDSVVVVAGEIVTGDSLGLGGNRGGVGSSEEHSLGEKECDKVTPGDLVNMTDEKTDATVQQGDSSGPPSTSQAPATAIPTRATSKRPRFQLAATFSK